jgi:glycine betaine/proline transport system substrate-binding protein
MKRLESYFPATHLIAGVLAISSLSFAMASQAADVVIGEPNWPSAKVTANILKVILEDNLGLEVELQSGNNAVIFEAMDKGSMGVHPEVWLPNQKNLHDIYVTEKGTVLQSKNSIASTQGMCVTKYTAQTTGIKSLSDLADPEVAKHFDTDGDGKGEVWIGVPGWQSTNIEKIRAKSYGYDLTMTYKELDESLALAEVDKAIKSKKPFVFFCYTPHHMFSLYDLVILEEPTHDAAKWIVYQPTDHADWLEKSTAGTAYSSVFLSIHYARALEKSHPLASRILSNVKFTTDMVSEMTYAVVVQKKSAEDFAKAWISENSQLVDSWLK